MNVSETNECSYIAWFTIDTWSDGKKILFEKSVNGVDDFIVFIGDLTNVLYIYTTANVNYDKGITTVFRSEMLPYNDCNVAKTFYNLGNTANNMQTFVDCQDWCIDNNCVGFAFANGSTGGATGCYTSYNTQDIFTGSGFTGYTGTTANFCSNISLQLKVIEVTHIPLQKLVKLIITINNGNMIVYIDDKLINTYFLKPTTISSGIITVIPTGYWFNGYTRFKYIEKCLNYQEIKVLH
jgi:hypothetical protein